MKAGVYIPPEHRIPWVESIFYGTVLKRALRKAFHAVMVAGGENLKEATAHGSAVVCSNHTNWWDGFSASWVTRHVVPGCGYMLAMDAKNLARYRFFEWLGVFGVRLSEPRAAALALRGAAEAMSRGREACWIFPQGELLHPGIPVTAKSGAVWLAKKAGVPLVPVAFSYEWLIESRPVLLARVGAPLATLDDAALAAAINMLREQVVRDAAALDLKEYAPILEPRRSLNNRWDQVMAMVRGKHGSKERFNR